MMFYSEPGKPLSSPDRVAKAGLLAAAHARVPAGRRALSLALGAFGLLVPLGQTAHAAQSVFMSGFETGDASEWTSSASSSATTTQARSGSYSGYIAEGSGDFTRTETSSSTTVGIRFAVRFTDATPSALPLVMSIGHATDGNQWVIQITTAGKVRVRNYRSAIAWDDIDSTNAVFSDNTWHLIEFKGVVHASAGSFALRVDGTEVIAQSGLDTQYETLSGINQIKVSNSVSTATNIYYDDVYWTTSNAYPGDGKIVALQPNGSGDETSTNWTNRISDFAPCASYVGSYITVIETPHGNFSNCVDNSGQSDSYITNAATSGSILFALEDFPGGSTDTINDVWYRMWAQRGTGGGTSHYLRKKWNGTAAGTAVSLGTSGALHSVQQTGTLSVTNVTSAQMGADISGAQDMFVDTLWMMVDYTPGSATISGTAYSNETGTALASSGGAIKLVNNTTGATFSDADGTDGSGNWSITGVTLPSNGDVLTIWIDGATADASLVLKYGASCTGAPNCTGLSLYQNRTILRNEHTGNLVTTDFANCDNDSGTNCADTEIGFTANGGVFTGATGRELHLWTGDTYAPGGNVTTPNLHVAGTYTGSTETLDFTGSGTSTTCTDAPGTVMPLCVGGTFTPPSTVNYTGTAGNSTLYASSTYTNLGVGTTSDALTGRTFTLGGNTTVSGTLTVGNAASTNFDTLAGSSYTLTLSGTGTPFVLTSKGLFTGQTSTVNYTATGGNATLAAATYHNLGVGTTADGLTGRTFTLSGTTSVGGVVTVGNAGSTNADTLAGSSYALSLDGSGTPFVITSKGAFSYDTSTVKYQAAVATTITRTTYYDLELTPGANSPTYTLAGGGTLTINHDLNIGTSGTVTVDANTNDPPVTVANNFTIGTGDVYSASNTQALTIGGNFTNNGSFTSNGGPIVFNDNSKISSLSYSAGTSFGSFSVTTSGKQIKFDETDQTTVGGVFTITGADCTTGRVFLDSTTNDDQFALLLTSTRSVTYADIEDSNAVAAITADNATQDNDNNTGWTINAGACGSGVTISGTAYTNETGSTLNSSGGAIKLVNNTTGATFSDADGTDASGNFSITGVTAPSNGDVLTIWIDGATADGSLVLKYGASCTGAPNCTGLSIYQNRTILRNEHTGNLVTTDFANCDNDTGANCTDAEIGFTANSGVFSGSSGRELHVWTGDTYAPGGNVTTPNLHVAGTYTGSTETLTLSGAGTSGTCTDAPGTVRPLCVSGTFTAPSTTNFTTTTGDVSVQGGSYANLGVGTTSDSSTGRTFTAAGDIAVSGTLTVGNISSTNSDTLAGSSYTLSFTQAGSPFSVTPKGAFQADSSTVSFDGTIVQIPPMTAYSTLRFSPASGSVTHNLPGGGTITADNLVLAGAGNVTVSAEANDPILDINNLTIGSGDTFSASSTAAFNVGGNWSNSGTFTPNSGTVTFDATDTGNTLSGTLDGSSAFNKVVFNGTGGEWTVSTPMTVTSTAADALDLQAGTVIIGNGTLDNFAVYGGVEIAATAGETATLRAKQDLAQGESITIDINNNTPVLCANCIVKVGASSGGGTGTLDIGRNVVLRLNPFDDGGAGSDSDTGIEVEATGYLNIEGTEDATGTLTAASSLATRETTLCSTNTYAADAHNGKQARITNTDSLAFGRIYAIADTIADDANCGTSTHDSLVIADASSATDTAPDVQGGAACASGICAIDINDALIAATKEGVGRYVHNLTDDAYYLIVDSLEAATDNVRIITNAPDDFTTMDDGDDIEITDGIRAGDTFAVYDYAHVTAESGTTCPAYTPGLGEAYILLKTGSESLIRYAEVCNMGRDDATTFHYGIHAASVNGSNSAEGIAIDASRVINGYRGFNCTGCANNTAANSEGVSGTAFSGHTNDAVHFESSSEVLVSGNRVFSNGGDGIDINAGSGFFSVTGNHVAGNTSDGIQIWDSDSHVITGNLTHVNGGHGIFLASTASRSLVASNKTFANTNQGLSVNDADTNLFALNTIVRNTLYGVSVNTNAADNVFVGNDIGGNTQRGLQIGPATGTRIARNRIYDNTTYGLAIGAATDSDVWAVAESYGNPANTTADVEFVSTGAHTLRSMGSSLGAVGTGITVADAYILSLKDGGTAGAAKIWGEYAIPDDLPGTPADEALQQFNYADQLYADGFTEPAFLGTGDKDTDLQLGFSAAMAGSEAAYAYHVRCKAAAGCATGGSNDWDVYRDGTDVGDASTNTQFTDAATNVRFTIQDVGVNYAKGAAYQFIAFKGSADANAQKTLSFMQDGDWFTLGFGHELQLKGQSGSTNPTLITRGGGSGGYNFTVLSNATIDWNGYRFDYLGGTNNTIGIDISTGAIVTDLSNGAFDNFAVNGFGNDSYLNIHGSLVDAGPRTFTGMVFDDTTTYADQNVAIHTTTPNACTDTWTFQSSGDMGGTNGESRDTDMGDGGGCNSGNGYLLWTSAGATVSGRIYTDEGTTALNCSTSRTVALSVNGAAPTTVECSNTPANGSYSFTGVTVSAGQTLHVFLQDETENATTVTRAPSSGDVTGLDLYQNRLIVRHEDAGPTANSDLGKYDNTSGGSDGDVLFDVDASPNLVVNDGAKLLVPVGHTFTPGGTVTTSPSAGSAVDGDVYVVGTLNMGTHALSIGGSYANSGTLTVGAGQVTTFTATGGTMTLTGSLSTAAGSPFSKVVFDGIGGAWVIHNAMTVSAANAADTLRILNGTVTLGNGNGDNLEVLGKFVIADGATFQTKQDLAQGSAITIDINSNASPTDCANCIIDVAGTLDIAENVILRLNPGSTTDTAIEVAATGYLEIDGQLADSGTSSGGTAAGSTARLCASGKTWTADQFNGMHVRIHEVFSTTTAAGDIYEISDTLDSDGSCAGSAPSLLLNNNASSTDANPTVTGGTCSAANAKCIVTLSADLVSAANEHVGRYLHNITDGGYYRIVDSTTGASDTLVIVDNTPGDYTAMGSGDDIEIVDVASSLISGLDFEIYDYAHVTGQAGTACTAANPASGGSGAYPYIYSKQDSETLIRYADICDLGEDVNTHEGVQASNVDGSAASEGFTVSKSRIHRGFRGIELQNSKNLSISDSAFTFHTNKGANEDDSAATIASNSIARSVFYGNSAKGLSIIDGYNARITDYIGYGNEDVCIQLAKADNSVILRATCYGLVTGSTNSIGILVDGTARSIIGAATIYGLDSNGVRNEPYSGSPSTDNVLFANAIHHTDIGFQTRQITDGTTGNISILDTFGPQNSTDVSCRGSEAGPCTAQFFGSVFNSATEVGTNVTTAGSYYISRKHDGTAGSTKIWNEYTVPEDDANTANNEGLARFNYADALWPDSFTKPGYGGAGTQDSNLELAFSAAMAGASDAYAYYVVYGGSNWTVYRYDSDGAEVNAGTATTGVQFSDATTNVQFKIDGGSPAGYAAGDVYSFVAFKTSGDTNTQKSLTLMQDADSFTVGSGETLEMKGQAAGTNVTQVTRGATGGYQFVINGTIDADAYSFDYLGGTGQASGLDINAGATVTSLDNGAFDNFAVNVGSADSFIDIDQSLIGSGTPSKTVSSVSFVNTGSNANFNINATGSGATGYWNFEDATGAFAGESYDAAAGSADGTPGLVNWTVGGITVSGRLYTDEGTTALNCSTSRTVALSVNGAAPTTVECSNTPANGSYSFTGVTVSAGQSLHVFLQDETENATTVTRAADGTTDVTGLDLYQDRLTVRHEDAGPITNQDLGKYDNDDDAGADLGFTSNLTTLYDLVVADGWKLIVWAGDSFTPGGMIDTSNASSAAAVDGDLRIAAGATLNMENNRLTVGGDFANQGTYTTGTAQQTRFQSGAAGLALDFGAAHTVDSVRFASAAGTATWSVANNTLTIGDDLDMDSGTLDNSNGSADIIVTDNVECSATPTSCGTLNFTAPGHTFKHLATESSGFGPNYGSGNWTFRNLVFDAASGTQTVTVHGTGTGQIVVNENLILQTNGGGTGVILDNETNDRVFDVAVDVSIGANTTLQASSTAAFRVGGSWSNSGAFTANSGTVTFDDTDGDAIISGSLSGASSFYAVVFDGVDGAWAVLDSLTVASSAANALDIRNGTVTLGDGNGDSFAVSGGVEIAATAGETGTLRSFQSLPEGSSITIDINTNTPVLCANCIVKVGAASGGGTGTLDIGKNVVLRLNPYDSGDANPDSDTGIAVYSTGYLEIQGSVDQTGATDQSASGTSETRLCLTDASESYADNQHTGKMIRMATGLAAGMLYPITATTASDATCAGSVSSLTRADTSSADTTASSVSGTGPTRTITTAASVISANDEGVGRYLNDKTGTKGYHRIIDTIEGGAADQIQVIADPDALNIAVGDSIDITDGVRNNDTYEIHDYAHVTAEAGTACNAAINQGGEAYIEANAGSQVLIRYAEICNHGRSSRSALSVLGVNGATANEGVVAEKSYFRNSYLAFAGSSAPANNTFSDNRFSGAEFYTEGTGHQISGNRFSDMRSGTYAGLYLYEASGNTISNNIVDASANANTPILICDDNLCHNNVISGNTALRGTFYGIQVDGNNNVVRNNTVFGMTGTGSGMVIPNGSNNLLIGNTVMDGSATGIRLDTGNHTALANEVFGHTASGFGIYLSALASNNVRLINNQSYSNIYGVGYNNDGISYLIGGSYGSGGNTNSSGDLRRNGSTTHVLAYGAALDSSSEISGVLRVLSRKHDNAAAQSRFWGAFTLPADTAETPQNEGSAQFNYADPLWPDMVISHIYSAGSGAGAEDANLAFSFNGAMGGNSDVYVYRVVCAAANCVTASDSWDIYRYDSAGTETLLTAKASTGAQYTDSQNDGATAPNVRFTIEDAGADYTAGAAYTFVAVKTSGDQNQAKNVSFEYNTGTLTVPSGTTLEIKGASGNQTTLTRSSSFSGTQGYSIDIAGAIDAQYYTISYLSGADGIGLDLQSTATVTNLSNGTFNNYQDSGGASDTYIRAHSNLISTGTPTKDFSSVAFTQSGGQPEYSITESGGTAQAGYWNFTNAACTGWTACEDSDSEVAATNPIRFTDGLEDSSYFLLMF